MKIAIITDTHAGMRGDNRALKAKQEKFYADVFFPYINRNNIGVVLHLGDMFDRRKYINFETLSWWNRIFMEPLREKNVEMHTVVGNHDCYFKSTNNTNSLKEIYSDTSYSSNFHFYWDKPVELEFESLKIMMCPWLAPSNEQVCLEAIEKTDARILMGHFELQGFSMGRGQLCDHGLDAELFSKFLSVYSGHFHTQSKGKNVHYLGTPYQMTWSDYGDRKGFHILDTETLELEFIENPYNSFIKIKYEDSDLTVADVASLETEHLENAFVKVVVINKTNSYLFDLFLDKLNSANAADVKVVDDNKHLDDISDEELLSETESTDVILKKYVESLDVGVDKKELSNFILGLYDEAMSL